MSDSILVVDDDEAVGKVLAALLSQAGHQSTWVGSAEAALATLEKREFDLVISDVRMPGLSGMDLLKLLRQKSPDLPVVLLTAHGTVQMAVEAMRDGAADFMLKPFNRDEVLFVVKKCLSSSESERAAPPKVASAKIENADGMVGSAPALEEARAVIRQAAASPATVLVLGETGTGKELAARALHSLSPRAKGPFVRLNCGALPETLFESELFGYEKGAFTGATGRKPGRVELANGGTLFLDEVGELSLASQVKLLRLIQEKEFERLGGTETLKADVRVVAATHRNLAEMVKAGTFREDLYYRLNVVPVSLPPLRARPDDVAVLARHFITALGPQNGRPKASFAPEALTLLSAQQWPGNVRQLQNFIERVLVLAPPGDVIEGATVEKELARAGLDAKASTPAASPDSLPERRKDAERQAVEEALQKAGGNRSVAARLLGVSRRTLYNKLEALGLALTLALLFIGCGAPPCSPSTCPIGCCSSAGKCESGTAANACGIAGASCNACTFTQQCIQGQCFSSSGMGGGGGSSGGGTGGGGGGGSTTGGGGGTTGGGGGLIVFPTSAAVPFNAELELSALLVGNPSDPAVNFAIESGPGYVSRTSTTSARFFSYSSNATVRIRASANFMSSVAQYIDLRVDGTREAFEVQPGGDLSPFSMTPNTRQTFAAVRRLSGNVGFRGVDTPHFTLWPSRDNSSSGTFTVDGQQLRVYARETSTDVWASAELDLFTTSLPTLTISPSYSSTTRGGVMQLSATTSDGSAVEWQVLDPIAGGSVSQTGLFTAPMAPGIYVVGAQPAGGNGTRFALASIVVP